MIHCDVLVAGGGPAGLATAIALRQLGADVLVADAQQPPVDKPCGEGLMPDSLRDLARLGVEPDERHGAKFDGILFAGESRGSSVSAFAPFPHGMGLGLRRTVLHGLLLERARELGVRSSWRTPVVLQPGVTIGSRSVVYRWLVGADGNASRVRAWAGLEKGSVRSRRYGFRAHFRLRPWSRHVEVHWGATGQAYITPVGPEEICVAALTRNPQARLAQIVAGIPSLGERLAGAERTTAERGALTLTRQLRRVTRGSVVLVGDASGSVDAITGEGLALGFRQARSLAESLLQGDTEAYEAAHRRILKLPQWMAETMMLMDRFPALRERALPSLAARPEIFRAMLAVHVGEQALPRFLLQHGTRFGAALLAA